MTEADAWAAYEAAINRQYDHPKACDRCMAPLSAEVQPGSLLSVFAAPCDVAVRLDAETEAAHDALTQRRLHARLDAEYERDTAELRALQAGPLAYRYRFIETLLSLPGRPLVDHPDHHGVEAPAVGTVVARPLGRDGRWWQADTQKVRDAAVYWLAMREWVTAVHS